MEVFCRTRKIQHLSFTTRLTSRLFPNVILTKMGKFNPARQFVLSSCKRDSRSKSVRSARPDIWYLVSYVLLVYLWNIWLPNIWYTGTGTRIDTSVLNVRCHIVSSTVSKIFRQKLLLFLYQLGIVNWC